MNKKTPNEDLNRLNEDEFKDSKKTPIIIVLDNVRSALNVGSIFRTADSFLIEKVFLCGITPTPPSREMNKTALGSTQTVSWSYVESTLGAIEDLKKEDVQCMAIEQTERSLGLDEFTVSNPEKYALVFGNEVDGVHQDVVNACHGTVEIPQFGTKHSLNISVCAGITVWHFFQLLKL
ncbi:MAG: RNA methyltransferase [Bacteroidota bacterium]